MLHFFLFIFSLISQSPFSSQVVIDENDRPNFIILFADDMGFGDVGCYGHPTIRTPNLDKMASNGMKFTNFYAASPACTASRYALLTGKYPPRSGFGWVLYPKSERGIHPRETTIAEALKEEGYATACYGKWHLGSTRPEYSPNQNGFDHYLGLPYSNDMIPPKWPAIPLLENQDTLTLNPDQTTLTQQYTREAQKFITAHKSDPFFLYVPYAMPHVPLHPGAAFKGTSKRGLYGDVIEEIDWSVGEILQTLQKEGLVEKTLVIFTSDNGPWIIKDTLGGSAGLLRDGKGSTWEGGMREPMIAWWPGKIGEGVIQMQTCSTIDLLPTITSLANCQLQTDQPIDGRDISGVLTANEELPERAFFYYKENELHAIRKGPWKLLVHTHSQTGLDYFEGKLPLLFNLDVDPSEIHDVSNTHPEIVNLLKIELQEHERNQIARSDYHTLSPLD